MTSPAEIGGAPKAARSDTPPFGIGGRIPQLDGLRGLAIGLVLVWHYFVGIPGADANQATAFLRRLFHLSWSGVDLFFVLSGFLIGGILMDNRESPRYFRTFYVRRVFRIVPAFLLLLVPFWVARSVVDTSGSVTLQYLLDGQIPTWSYGLFVQNLFMAAKGTFGANWMSITWSLAIEEQFYLALPLTLFWIPRRFVPHLCIALAALALGLRTVLALSSDSASAQAAAYLLLPSRMDGLFLGVLGAWLVREPRWSRPRAAPRRSPWLVIGVLGAGLVVASLRETFFVSPLMSTLGYSCLAVFYFAVLLVCFASERGALHALTTWGPLRALGQGSYFIYLFHPLFLVLAHHWAFGQMPDHRTRAGATVTMAALALLFAAAALSWRFVERPLLERGRKARY